MKPRSAESTERCCGSGVVSELCPFFLINFMSAQRTPVTVPCKYKTGKVLGNGTYATVKGTTAKAFFLPRLPLPRSLTGHGLLPARTTCLLEALHVSNPRLHSCESEDKDET